MKFRYGGRLFAGRRQNDPAPLKQHLTPFSFFLFAILSEIH
jgi:hypothetical protein